MTDDELMELTKQAVKAANERHMKRVRSGMYDADQLPELLANSEKSSRHYANSLVFETLKLLLGKNPHLLDDREDH